jgi:AraC-like DNA-binding protein
LPPRAVGWGPWPDGYRRNIRWYRSFRPPADLDQALTCTWQARVGGPHRLIPDGCVDVLWLDDGTLTVCGPELRSWSFTLPPGTEAVGVRFRPGAAAGALRVPMSELRDRRVGLDDVVGAAGARWLGERLADGIGEPRRQRQAFEGFVRRLAIDEPTDGATAVVARLVDERAAGACELADAVGLSTRQLHRRCTVAFGYGPATLARILRFQRFVRSALGRGPRRSAAPAGLARMAAEAGYADQAHLSRECRAITGETPTTLVATLADTSVDALPDLVGPGRRGRAADVCPIGSRPSVREGASSGDDRDRRPHPQAVRRLRGQGGGRPARTLVEPVAL